MDGIDNFLYHLIYFLVIYYIFDNNKRSKTTHIERICLLSSIMETAGMIRRKSKIMVFYNEFYKNKMSLKQIADKHNISVQEVERYITKGVEYKLIDRYGVIKI